MFHVVNIAGRTIKPQREGWVCTCCLRTRMIQVGGTMTAACAPRVQVSSMCCSMKQVTLLWYCKSIHRAISFIALATMFFLFHKHSQQIHLPPVCTKSNWWPRCLYCGRTSAGNPEERWNHFQLMQNNTIQYNRMSNIKSVNCNRPFRTVCTSHPAASCGPSDALQCTAEKHKHMDVILEILHSTDIFWEIHLPILPRAHFLCPDLEMMAYTWNLSARKINAWYQHIPSKYNVKSNVFVCVPILNLYLL